MIASFSENSSRAQALQVLTAFEETLPPKTKNGYQLQR